MYSSLSPKLEQITRTATEMAKLKGEAQQDIDFQRCHPVTYSVWYPSILA